MTFQTTLWSVVDLAKESGEDGSAALGILCETYWKPLYIYARRRGLQDEDARDAVQSFFLKVLEKDYLEPADKEKGRFRTFLLTCYQRFLSNEYKRENAQKRGGHLNRVHIDWQTDGIQIHAPSTAGDVAERQFERDWAFALLDRAMKRLTEIEERAGRGELLSRVGQGIFMGAEIIDYADLASELGVTKNSLKVAVHRLRKRLKDAIVDEVRLTVNSEDEIEEELQHLLQAVSDNP